LWLIFYAIVAPIVEGYVFKRGPRWVKTELVDVGVLQFELDTSELVIEQAAQKVWDLLYKVAAQR
jgi:hypothetical protein